MKRPLWLILFLAACLLPSGSLLAEEIVCPPEIARPEASLAEPAQVRVPETDPEATSGAVISLEPLDEDRLRAEDEARRGLNKGGQGGPMRIGVHRSLPAVDPEDWEVGLDSSGRQVFRLVINSPGAVMIRPHFSRLPAADKAAVYVYGQDRAKIEGPLAKPAVYKTIDFWGPPLDGEDYTIECLFTGQPRLDQLPVVDKISHVYRDAFSDYLNKVGSCHTDISCRSAAERARGNSVAGLATESGQTSFCTGCLLADMDSTTQIPWFLTANHCGITESTAPTTYFYFRYQTSSCNGAEPSMRSTVRRDGASHVISYAASDFTLLRLAQTPPAGSVFNAWRTRTIESGVVTTCIHHPDGSFKRISDGVTVNYISSSTFDQANHITNRWTRGTTEPGSSGSPLFDGGYVIGQLHGGPGSCTAGVNNYDYFGRFSVSYNHGLSAFLGPGARPNCTEGLSLGQTTSGALAAGCPADHKPGSYARYYAFSLSQTTRVSLEMRASFDAYLVLLNASRGLIASDNNSAGGTNARLVRTLQAGTYLVEATSNPPARTGSFNLTLGVVQDPACRQAIRLGQTLTGQLASNCASANLSGRYARYFSFTLSRRTRIDVNLTSTFDTYLFLLNSAGGVITSDDDGGTGYNSRITRTLNAGTYFLEATSYRAGATGAFQISLGQEAGISQACYGRIGLGQTVTGQLGPGCPSESRTGSYARYYTFSLGQRTAVTIALTASWDTFLYLFDYSGSLVTYDDDGGTDYNSRISRTLNAGSYTIEATSYLSGATGGFSLRLAR